MHLCAAFAEPVDDPLVGVLVTPIGAMAPAYWTHTFPETRPGTLRQYGPGRPLEVDIDLQMRLLAGGYTVTVGVRNAAGDLVLGGDPAADVLRDVPGDPGRRAGRPRSPGTHRRHATSPPHASSASNASERGERCASC